MLRTNLRKSITHGTITKKTRKHIIVEAYVYLYIYIYIYIYIVYIYTYIHIYGDIQHINTQRYMKLSEIQ